LDTVASPLPAISLGTEIDNSVVSNRVRAALLADPNIKSYDFKVETRKGEVQLSGFVNNQGQMDRAVKVARGITGVRSVSNEMSIKK
jgi:hyperosmotically inducible protein